MSWKIVQCCEAGKKHRQGVCQDRCCCEQDGTLDVMALCDGTSDAEHSDVGAQCVAEFTVQYLKNNFEELCQAGYGRLNELLTKYHQNLLVELSKRAEEATGVPILNDRTIITAELHKYSTTVQAVAVQGKQVFFYKVGNGSALILGKNGVRVLSTSSTESPTKQVVLAHPLTVLRCSELKRFELEKDDVALILMTDGVEHPQGAFYNGEVGPELELLTQKLQAGDLSEEALRECILAWKDSPRDLKGDDIGVSVLYRSMEGLEKTPPEKATEASEEPMEFSPKTPSMPLPKAAAPAVEQFSFWKLPKKAEESEETAPNEAEALDAESGEQKRSHVKQQDVVLKRVLFLVAIAFLVGCVLGCAVTSLVTVRRIDALTTVVEQLADEVGRLRM